MTDLQLYSLIGGGAIVAVVYAFNWWQEYRYRKEAGRAFARNQPDVLLETPKNMVRTGESRRLEPMLDPVPTRSEPELPSFNSVDEELVASDVVDVPASFRVDADPVPADREDGDDAATLATSLLDPMLDLIVEVHASEFIPAEQVPPFPAAKRVLIIGRDEQDHWELVAPRSSARYTELRVALQLADRQGALTQEQLNAFCMTVQQFADAHDAYVTFPQRASKLIAARELDEFCASVDVLIGLNVVAKARPFAMAEVRALAENAGLTRTADGNLAYRSESGKTLFTLGNHDEMPLGSSTSEGLTLLFDVPRVAGGLAVFDYLVDFAQSLASALQADLVDDNGKPLSDTSIGNIRKQLATIYSQMDDRGIAAGSMAALRLFA